MLVRIASWVSIILIFGFALVQLLLALGAPIGEYALGGMHRVLPLRLRFVSGFFSVLWTVVGFSFLQKTEKITSIFNDTFVNVLLVIYTIFLAYSIFGNGFITQSLKEKYVMTPLSVIGFISSVIVLYNR